MKIVVPISLSDVHRLDNWVAVVKKFGGLDTHSILFVPMLSVVAKAYEAAAKLSEVCKDIRVSPLDMDNNFGWPIASNWQWWSASVIMEQLQSPWFWMELDCLPVRSGWATEIAGAYTSSGHPFLGCIVKTPHIDENKKEVEGPEGDVMMCGCGVYPSALHERMKRIGETPGVMGDFVKGAGSIDQPWDLHIRSAASKLGMGHTSIIADFWNTQNYRVEDNRLICDAKETGNDGKRVSVRRAGVVNSDAVVVHGCKDESLFRLIIGGLDTRTLTPPKNAPAAQQQSLPQSTEDPRIAAMEKQMEEMRSMLAEALKSKEAPKEEPLLNRLMAEEMSEDDPSEAIVNCIKNSKTKLRLAQVAGLTKISSEIIRELADSPDAKFEIGAGGLAWMKLKEAPARKIKFKTR